MSKVELKKLKVLDRVEHGCMSVVEGARALGISDRQMRRLRKRYRLEGENGIIHRNRGRKPHHAISDEVREVVITLFGDKYAGFNFTHFAEKLREVEDVRLSESSVGRILRAAGVVSKARKRRRPKKHPRRERRSQAGSLWQTDATSYAWLGDEFGRFALHAVIDDATGIVVGAFFARNECYEGYVECMKQGIKRYGVPLELYSDRHTIFRSPNEELTIEQQLDGISIPLSNFGYAMAELGIKHIKAHTPQAKGRIERLWLTLQDRLTAELRRLRVKSIDKANAVLQRLIAEHNAHFAVAAAEPETAYRPLDAGVDLDLIFARRETRKVDAGSSVSYKGKRYVAADAARHLAPRTTLEIRETIHGAIIAWIDGVALRLRELETVRRSAGPAIPRDYARQGAQMTLRSQKGFGNHSAAELFKTP